VASSSRIKIVRGKFRSNGKGPSGGIETELGGGGRGEKKGEDPFEVQGRRPGGTEGREPVMEECGVTQDLATPARMSRWTGDPQRREGMCGLGPGISALGASSGEEPNAPVRLEFRAESRDLSTRAEASGLDPKALVPHEKKEKTYSNNQWNKSRDLRTEKRKRHLTSSKDDEDENRPVDVPRPTRKKKTHTWSKMNRVTEEKRGRTEITKPLWPGVGS